MKLPYAASIIILAISCSVNVASSFASFPTALFGTHPNHTGPGGVKGSTSTTTRTQSQLPFHTGGGATGGTVPRGGGGSSSKQNSVLSSSETTCTTDAEDAHTSFVSENNLALLSLRGKTALSKFIAGDDVDRAQTHVYADWPPAGEEDDQKVKLCDQLADLDASYPGGLTTYLAKAKTLLQESADGTNPFTDFVASVPVGETLTYDEQVPNDHDHDNTGMTFAEAEEVGLTGIADVAFVLVAGGLGERLGFSGIKLSLETNLCTNKSYLAVYSHYIQAMQRMAQIKTGRDHVRIPLVIMTSGDTDPLTRQLLRDNDNFGFEEGQVRIVCQDKVAALRDSNAGLSMSDRWEVETKPHGHGDVHHLLFREGHVERWVNEGRKHVVFLQDTNALVINSILPTLGVSIEKGFHMNSICIPRLAEEAAGAIARLEHTSDPEKSLVINVEYNQLDPLLSTQGDGLGDVADPATGYSPYPGNANNLVLELDSYFHTLQGEDQGVVLEFVNPKYKDDTRTEFKKPTRLECMMQDFPKLLQKEMGSEANVGFTMYDRWFTFSPAKNSLDAGVDAVSKGNTAPGTMSSAENDKYVQNQRKLKFAGMNVPVTTDADLVTLSGIPVTPGPYIILCPAFAITQNEVKNKIEGGTVTRRSSLVLEGESLRVKNLDLDGALIIRTGYGCEVEVDGLVVRNRGWEMVEVKDGDNVPETVAIRGYTMTKHDVLEILITEPGKYRIGREGVVEKLN